MHGQNAIFDETLRNFSGFKADWLYIQYKYNFYCEHTFCQSKKVFVNRCDLRFEDPAVIRKSECDSGIEFC